MDCLNGNYISYATSTQNYKQTENYYGTPPFTENNDRVCPKSTGSEFQMQRDGVLSQVAPYYQLGPIGCQNCPFYNYLLPYNYPYVNTNETPDPKYYWYFPYYSDPTFYENPYDSKIKKPSS